MNNRTCEFEDVEAIRETEAAILCLIEGDEVWIPKSCIDDDESDVRADGDLGTLVISEWIAIEKELV